MSPRGHVPLRRCVGCRRSRPQAELLRFAQDEAGVWRLDAARRAGGRGSWVCRDTPACWTPKRLGRTFRGQTEHVCTLLRELYERTPHESGHDEPGPSHPKTNHHEPSHEPNHHELDRSNTPDRRI